MNTCKAVISMLVCILMAPSEAKTILVTGGAGFIGSHVAKKLLERGDKVIAVDSLNDYYNPKIKQLNIQKLSQIAHDSFTFYKLDICNQNELNKIFEVEKPDLICHLAARAGVRASLEDPELYFEANIIGTLHIYQAAVTYQISHVVVASSSSVYGNCTETPFNEQFIVDKPCSPYALTKRCCELLGYNYHYLYGLSTTLLRFFTVYGPSGRPDMAPFKFMDLIYHNKPIQQYGDGMSMRDFTYVDDIVDGIILALDLPLGFEIVNLGRGEPVCLKDFIITLEKVMGKKALIEQLPMSKGDVEMTHADITKAQMLLGYAPKISLHDGLAKTYEWYINEYIRL